MANAAAVATQVHSASVFFEFQLSVATIARRYYLDLQLSLLQVLVETECMGAVEVVRREDIQVLMEDSSVMFASNRIQQNPKTIGRIQGKIEHQCHEQR